MGISAHSTKNSGKASPGAPAQGLQALEWRSRHSRTEVWMPSASARTAITVQGIIASSATGT